MLDNPQDLTPLSGLAFDQAIDGGARFVCGGEPLEVSSYAPGILRLRIGEDTRNDYGILASPREPRKAEIENRDGGCNLATDGISLRLTDDPLHFDLRVNGLSLVKSVTDAHFARRYRLPCFARTENGWFATFNLDSGEPVYGLGEKFGPLNKRGQLIVSWAEDALGVNAEKSYKNCPFAWSPRGWGVFTHTSGRVSHGVGYGQWSHRSYGLAVEDRVLDIFFLLGKDGAEVLERYTWLTGRAPKPPRWSYGVWLSRAYYRTADEALEAAEKTRQRRIPCDVLNLDGRAWLDTETRFAFEWDKSRYPDPTAFTAKIAALDMRVCAWEYPLVSVKHPLFQELADKGWLLKNADGGPYVYQWDRAPFGDVLTPLPDSGLVDFTHPDAYAWYRDSHAKLFDSGIHIMKTDFGEQVPEDAVAHNGDTGAALHNVYPLLYTRCVYEATRQRFGDDALVWGRSGFAGVQRYPLQWGGDPQTDWEGLAASLRGGLSWGMSGVPFYSHDVGGFYGGTTDSELFVRWVQAGVFTSHFRFHGIGEREPWVFGDNIEAIVRDWLDLRYRLIPYLQSCAEQAAETGLPVMRAMALAFPEDPASWAFEEQFMCGDSVLVAPVVKPGGGCRYYLPKGEWFDFWTGDAVAGGDCVDAELPLDRIPIFVRAGSILPLGPVVQHTGELTAETAVETIRVFGLPEPGHRQGTGPFRLVRDAEGQLRISGLPEETKIEVFGNAALDRKTDGLIVNKN